jgi:hypothetical protein
MLGEIMVRRERYCNDAEENLTRTGYPYCSGFVG